MNEIIATVSKSHGAYLVSFDYHDNFQDSPAVELYDCASSLAVAKRLAKEGAKGADFTRMQIRDALDLAVDLIERHTPRP